MISAQKILINFLILPLLIIACSTAEKEDLNTPSGLFNSGVRLENNDRYEEALQRFTDVKNKHPYSRFAAEAELHIADIHYKREAFIEAKNAYQMFKELHPKHAKSDYVTFRLAMSLFNQLPSSVDRDLTPAAESIQYFDEVIQSYKNSTYVKEANEKKAEMINQLAKKELYIANFYLKKEKYLSAFKRYEALLKTYPNIGYDSQAMYGAFVSALELGDLESGKQYYQKLNSSYPNSDELMRARERAQKHGIQ